MLEDDFEIECDKWLCEKIGELTDDKNVITVAEWAEEKRYMPASVTPKAGFFRFEVTPYLKEIANCLSVNSPVQEVAIMKGAQLGFSQGIIENSIGYEIEHVKKYPCMFVTADAELARTILETRIQKMVRASDLEHLIMSSDEKNARKQGSTSKRMEWQGGGFLLPFGANNAAKLRSFSIARLYLDEIDGFPITLKREGSPIDLAVMRTAAFEEVRKIVYISTPLIKQTSQISKLYELGDKRKYFVPCPHCGEFQILRFSGAGADGEFFGLAYETDTDGSLLYDTVRYICKFCSGEIQEHQKHFLLNGGEWRPTGKSKRRNYQSYHISSLYSPEGFQSWASCIEYYLKAWNIELNRVKDTEALRTFYNLILGETYEETGDSLRLEQVVLHRRLEYYSEEVPNWLAIPETGGVVQLLTCAVDVQKSYLSVQVVGHCFGRRTYSIANYNFEGDCADKDSEDSPWQSLRDLIETKVFKDKDGRSYRILITLVDAGYSPSPDLVYEFCSEYTGGVFPIMGRDFSVKNANFKEFSVYQSKTGVHGFNITTTIYKDRLSRALKREWLNDGSLQPADHPNFPADYTDKFFKELTVETKKEKVNKVTGQREGFVWYRPSGVDNEAFDTGIYNMCALDIVCSNICQEYLKEDIIDHKQFFEITDNNKLFYEG